MPKGLKLLPCATSAVDTWRCVGSWRRGVPTLSGVRLQALLAKLLSVHISRHTFSEGLVASAISLVVLS